MRQTLILSFVALLCGSLLAVAPVNAAKQTPSSQKSLSCDIKGNISIDKKKEKIYHLPGCASYKATIIDTSKGERWFCSEKEAKDAGWRKALNCPK